MENTMTTCLTVHSKKATNFLPSVLCECSFWFSQDRFEVLHPTNNPNPEHVHRRCWARVFTASQWEQLMTPRNAWCNLQPIRNTSLAVISRCRFTLISLCWEHGLSEFTHVYWALGNHPIRLVAGAA